jgi:hypothetical protein
MKNIIILRSLFFGGLITNTLQLMATTGMTDFYGLRLLAIIDEIKSE